MHIKTFTTVLTLLFCINSVLAAETHLEVISKLHKASEDIEHFANRDLIIDSIYKQLRPRANITNTALSEVEIDRKVRAYISEKYAPVLIKNYALLYSKLRGAKKDFSNCEDLKPFNLSNDVLMALCIKVQPESVRVQYMTNGYGQGWSTAAIFTFSTKNSSLILNAINLQMKEGTKAYVEGL